MTLNSRRPLLYNYFQNTANVLLAEYERSREQNAATNLGENRELFCNNFLSRVLPPRLELGRGEIWDSQGNRSGQLDIIILRDDCPSLMFGQSDTYLAEGVFAAIEVKSNLTRNKLREALNTLRLVRSLNPITGGPSVAIGNVLARPLRCIFAYEGATWNTLLDELGETSKSDIVDLICILNRGILISRGLILHWKDDVPFHRFDGRASALAWFYFHLVQYSISFMARSWNIEPYFQPFDGWVETNEG